MRKRQRPIRVNRLFLQIWLYFLSLLLPVVLIGTFTYFHFVNQFKRDYTEKMTINLQSSAATIDNDLRMVQELAVGFFNDSSVIRLFKPYTTYTLQERAEISQVLGSLRNLRSVANDFVDELFVFTDFHKVYTSAGLVDFDSFFDTHYRFDQYDKSFWQKKLGSGLGVDILDRSLVSTPLAQKQVIPLLTTGVVQGNKTLLAASVSIEAIQKTLKGSAASPSTRFIVTARDRFLLASDPGFPNQLATEEISMRIGAGPGYTGTISIQNETYIPTIVRSEMYGWDYYALTPIGEFNKQASGIVSMIVIICTVLVVTGVAFSFVFTYRIYNPIRHISEILSRKEDDDSGISNEEAADDNEFARIGQGIHRLIGHNRKFQDELHHVSTEYLDYALLQMIQGNDVPKELDISKMIRSQMRYKHDSFICCTILFDFQDEFYASIQDVDRIRIQSKLKKLIAGMLQGCADLYVLECKQHQYISLFNVEAGSDLAAIREALTRFTETFRYDALYCKIHVGIGSVSPGLEGIAESYRVAMADLQSQTPCAEFLTLRAEDREIRYSAQYFFSDENKLLNLLKAGDADAAAEFIEDMLRASEEKGASPQRLSMLLSDMYHTAERFMSERGIAVDGHLSDGERRLLIQSGEHGADFASRKQQLLTFYRGLAGTTVRQQQAYKSGALVSTIMNYIDEHYAEDLYLDKISEEMNVSVKYVSRIFKEKTGMNITDYISEVRIGKAKELLVHTDLTIYDIAEKVGISNRTTFLRTFKKMEGLSPTDFRKSFSREASRGSVVRE